jgi:hypothetical protein
MWQRRRASSTFCRLLIHRRRYNCVDFTHFQAGPPPIRVNPALALVNPAFSDLNPALIRPSIRPQSGLKPG